MSLNQVKDNKLQEKLEEKALSLEEIMKLNEKKKEEIAKKRVAANKKVLKDYKIK